MFDKSTRSKQVCQLLFSLIVWNMYLCFPARFLTLLLCYGPNCLFTNNHLYIFVLICSTVQYRKWSPTVNDPETANDPQNGPQIILGRKWSLKSTTNDPVKTWGMEWILWEWLQKRTDYKKETFFSRLLKKKGGRTLHLRSIYTRRKKNGINLKRCGINRILLPLSIASIFF